MYLFKALALGTILMGNFMLSSIGIGDPVADTPTTQTEPQQTYGSKHPRNQATPNTPPGAHKLRYGDRITPPAKPAPATAD